MSEAAVTSDPGAVVRGSPLLSYVQDMLHELAHMASNGGETALAASLTIAAIQAGDRLRAHEREH